jgi:hypothetical protein
MEGGVLDGFVDVFVEEFCLVVVGHAGEVGFGE